MSIHSLRVVLRSDFNGVPGTNNKAELIRLILKIQSGEEIPVRSTKGRKPLDNAVNSERELIFSDSVDEQFAEKGWIKGLFEKSSDGFGFIRREDFSFSKCDVFVRETLVKRFGLKTGDLVEGSFDGHGDRDGYSVKNISFINGQSAEPFARQEDSELKVQPVVEKIDLSASGDYLIKAVDVFCPIGKGQRCLIVSENSAYATDFVKRTLRSLDLNDSELAVTTLLVGVKPETAVEMKDEFKNVVINVGFNEDFEKAVRICNLVVQSVKAKVKSGKSHLLIVDKLSAVVELFREYLSREKGDKYLKNGITAERFILDIFGNGGCFGDGRSLTVITSVGDVDCAIFKNLKEIANAILYLKGEGKFRKRAYKLDLANSWSDSDEILHGDEKIAKIDDIRDQACSSLEKEDELWAKLKSGEFDV